MMSSCLVKPVHHYSTLTTLPLNPQLFHILLIFQLITHTHTVKYYITVPSHRFCSALILAVCERSPVDPAQRVISVLFCIWVHVLLVLLCLPVKSGASGGEKHPSSQHQGKGDPSEIQRRSPVSSQQHSSLQWLTGVMACPGCGNKQQDPRPNKESTSKHFDLAAPREPHSPRRSDRRSKSPGSDGCHDEGSPRSKTSRKRHERLVKGAV